MNEINELIAKVHDHMEGRYDLDSLDIHNIHAALCELQNLKRESVDPRDLGLDDSWIHDIEMGNR